MDYHYQWPMSMGPSSPSSSVTEKKKWDESFWGKSPRCLGNPGPVSNELRRCYPRTRAARRRRFCPPPSNYFPRAPRPQWSRPAFHKYDHQWNQGVSDSMQPRSCTSSFDYDYFNLESTSKKRSCPKSGKSKKTSKSSSSEQYGTDKKTLNIDFFPVKSPQINPQEYLHHGEGYGGPSLNESAQNESECYPYSQLGLASNSQIKEYHQDCSRSVMCPSNNMKTESTINVLQPEVAEKNIDCSDGNCLTTPEVGETLNFIATEAIGKSLNEVSEASAPIPFNGSQSYEVLSNDPILENLETELAIRNLELLYPSPILPSEEQSVPPSGLINIPCVIPTTDQRKEQNDESFTVEIIQSQILPAQNQSPTTDNPNHIVSSESKVGELSVSSSMENSLSILPSTTPDQFVTQESITSLIQQNQLLADFVSQLMLGKFDFETNFIEECQMPDETHPEVFSAKSIETPNHQPTQSSSQIENRNEEIVLLKDPNLNETVITAMEIEEGLNVDKKEVPLFSISDIYDCDLLHFDLDQELSCMNTLASNNKLKDEETTLSSCTSYTDEEPDLNFLNLSQMKSIFDSEDTEEEILSPCVAPNSVLKEKKRPRKRLKKVVTNGQVKTKKVRRRISSSIKTNDKDEEQVVQSICETNFNSDGDCKAPVKIHNDAQTQTSDLEMGLKKKQMDVETQWTDDVKDSNETLNFADRPCDLKKECETRLISSCEENSVTETDPHECSPNILSCNPMVEVEDYSSSVNTLIQEDENIIAQDDSNTSFASLEKSDEKSIVFHPTAEDRSKKQNTGSDLHKTKHHHEKGSSPLKNPVKEDENVTSQDYSNTSFTSLESIIFHPAVRGRPKKQNTGHDLYKTKHHHVKGSSSSQKNSVQEDENIISQDNSNTSFTSLEMTDDDSIISNPAVRCRSKKQNTDIYLHKTKHLHIKESPLPVKNSVQQTENTIKQDDSNTSLEMIEETKDTFQPAVRDRSEKQCTSIDTCKIKHHQNKDEGIAFKHKVTEKHDSPQLRLFTRSRLKISNSNSSKSPLQKSVLRAKRTGLSKRDSRIQDTPNHSRRGMSIREKNTSMEASPLLYISLRRKRTSTSTPSDTPIKRQRMQSSNPQMGLSLCGKLGSKNYDNSCEHSTPKTSRSLRKHILRNTTI